MVKESFLSKLRNKKTIISDVEENLMKELMDTVEFETTEDGTTVTMTKAK